MILYTLQVYRGIAAVLVVLFHTTVQMDYFGYSFYPIIKLFRSGHAGVEFFFVLSGFIIYYVHKNQIGSGYKKLFSYLLKRFIRIFPIFWFLMFFLALLYLMFPNTGAVYHHELQAFILSLLLIPQSHPNYIGVAWTLSHEILFYIIFSFLLIRKSIGIVIFFIWQILVLIGVFVPSLKESHYLLSFLFSTYNFLFFIGLLAAILSDRLLGMKKNIFLFIFGNIFFIFTAFIDIYTSASYNLTLLMYGLGAFFIILNSSNNQLNNYFKSKNILLLIGNASFSIYLIHIYIILILSKIIIKLDLEHSNAYLMYLIIVVFSILSGIILHLYVEKPLIKYLQQKIRGNNI